MLDGVMGGYPNDTVCIDMQWFSPVKGMFLWSTHYRTVMRGEGSAQSLRSLTLGLMANHDHSISPLSQTVQSVDNNIDSELYHCHYIFSSSVKNLIRSQKLRIYDDVPKKLLWYFYFHNCVIHSEIELSVILRKRMCNLQIAT